MVPEASVFDLTGVEAHADDRVGAGLDEPARALAIGVNTHPAAAGAGLGGSGTATFDAAILATAIVGCIAIVAASTVLAWLSFRRQEL